MKREFLKELGLEKEIVEKVMTEYGKDVETYKAKAESVKTEIAAKDTEIESLKTQLQEANTAIDGFKALDVESIKKAAADWEQKAKDAESKREADLAALRFDHALQGKLTELKARDASIVAGLLNRDDLKLTDNGDILGLEEQLKKLKEEKAFLFEPGEEVKQPPQFVSGTGTQTQTSAPDTLKSALAERFKSGGMK